MRTEKPKTIFHGAVIFAELIYHTTVREVRSESGGATLGILFAMGKTITFILMIYAVFEFSGMRGALIRGDVFLFILSGVYLFLVHNAAMGKTLQGGNMFNNMMQHAPMTPMVRILSSAFASLYLQTLAGGTVLLLFYMLRKNLVVHDPVAALLPVLMAWAAGVVTGLMFLLFKPFAPRLVQLIAQVYMRLMLFTSGKFFTGNSVGPDLMPFLAWNPLFHCIDQARGAMFVNYVPRNTDMEYVIWFVLVGSVLGLMGEFWLRRTVSSSTAQRSA